MTYARAERRPLGLDESLQYATWSEHGFRCRTTSIDELHGDWLRDDSGAHSVIEQSAHCGPSALPIIPGPVVHIHADEGVSLGSVQPSGVLHRVIECARPIIQCIVYTGAKVSRNCL